MLDKHREELADMLSAASVTAGDWEHYGITLHRLGLRTNPHDCWALWQTATTIATRGSVEGGLARMAMMFAAALAEDVESYDSLAAEHRRFHEAQHNAALLALR